MPSHAQRVRNLELALLLGSTLGISGVLVLRMRGANEAANVLSLVGVIAGGVVGLIRWANLPPLPPDPPPVSISGLALGDPNYGTASYRLAGPAALR